MIYTILREEEVVTTQVTEVEVSLLGYIGNEVASARMKSDINIVQLSRRLANDGFNISSTTLGRIEKGVASLKIDDLQRIAVYFKMNITDFFPKEMVMQQKESVSDGLS